MSALIAWWGVARREPARPSRAPLPYVPPLCTSVDLVAFSLAWDASDDGQERAKEDLMRHARGYPTRRQLRRQIAHDREVMRLERMRSGQLEAFAAP